ncbi:hypothetical protein B0O80DRAFT_476017 [Mortierella sp. GBAus27b]|nr:hypothetical protein B0O80DRAFT_476017 [Mortierella sp. GBAus27b]
MAPSVRTRGRAEDLSSTATCTSPVEGSSLLLPRCLVIAPRSMSLAGSGGASYLNVRNLVGMSRGWGWR